MDARASASRCDFEGAFDPGHRQRSEAPLNQFRIEPGLAVERAAAPGAVEVDPKRGVDVSRATACSSSMAFMSSRAPIASRTVKQIVCPARTGSATASAGRSLSAMANGRTT